MPEQTLILQRHQKMLLSQAMGPEYTVDKVVPMLSGTEQLPQLITAVKDEIQRELETRFTNFEKVIELGKLGRLLEFARTNEGVLPPLADRLSNPETFSFVELRELFTVNQRVPNTLRRHSITTLADLISVLSEFGYEPILFDKVTEVVLRYIAQGLQELRNRGVQIPHFRNEEKFLTDET